MTDTEKDWQEWDKEIARDAEKLIDYFYQCKEEERIRKAYKTCAITGARKKSCFSQEQV